MRLHTSFLLASWIVLAGLVAGTAPAAPPEIGAPAPPFRFEGADGRVFESGNELSATAGRAVVIAWFPKAFTPG